MLGNQATVSYCLQYIPGESMSERLKGRTFLLGIGAQKAGTTWLYSYLRSHPDVYMSPIKELHYFDRIYRPDLCSKLGRPHEVRLARKLLQMEADEHIAGRPDIVDLLDRARMNYDPGAYLEFFNARAPERAKVVGEITPSYSLIGADGFLEIRKGFEAKGINLKLIFLLRDPVERFYSALRMLERANKSFSAERGFTEYLANHGFFERGLYHVTLKNIRASFREADVHIAFYETLFSQSEMERICEFLGIDPTVKARLDAKINESPGEAMTDDMRSTARERFADVYEFCKTEFGDALPSSWHS